MLTLVLVLDAIPLQKTGQSLSYDADGNEVTDGSIKDDGYYQAGRARIYWRDDNKKIVIDNFTFLQWQDNESVQKQWENDSNPSDTAQTYCSALSLGDYNDWRLPSIEELNTLVHKSNFPRIDDEFQFTSPSFYWSSTTYDCDTS